jgi:tRNA 2-thiouridine synthesizing protein A
MSTVLSDGAIAGLVVQKVVDGRGCCPGPLLAAKEGIGAVGVGQVLEVRSSDPSTKLEMAAWAGKLGHRLLGHVPGDGYERIFIRRTK